MAIEAQRLRIRQSLEEKLGVAEATFLMDRPPGGWSDLVTNRTLDLKFEVLDERFKAIDDRFKAIDGKFSGVDDKLRILEANLALRIQASADQLRAEMERGFRTQTWRLTTAVIAGMAVMGGVFAGLVSITAG